METFLEFKVSKVNYFSNTIRIIVTFVKKITMSLSPLSAISPIDGRYHNATAELSAYFSEYALIKYRVFVEVEYFIALCEHPLPQLQNFDKDLFEELRDIYRNLSEADAQEIKDIEKNHQS